MPVRLFRPNIHAMGSQNGRGAQTSRGVATALRAGTVLLGGCAMLGLSGCATLPVSGPTGNEVEKQATAPGNPMPFRVVEVSDIAHLPPPAPAPLPLAEAQAVPTDLVGPGDVLDVAIYEAGVSLFGAGGARTSSAAGSGTVGGTESLTTGFGGAQAEHLPPVRVDDGGLIRLPYAGEIRAAGHTTSELSAMIRARLARMSQDPQVVVTINQAVSGSIIVSGDVQKPGRLVLVTRDETVSDAIALSGGYRGEAKDLMARVTRAGTTTDIRMADVMAGPARDMHILPGDRVAVVRAPLTFSVLGAAGKVDQMSFAAPTESLTEAVAAVGGANPYLGNAKAVFVFRYEVESDGSRVPVVYHFNMMQAGTYFLAQNFAMRDKDVLFIGNAASNQPSKLIQLISQMFSPIVAVESGLVATGAVK